MFRIDIRIDIERGMQQNYYMLVSPDGLSVDMGYQMPTLTHADRANGWKVISRKQQRRWIPSKMLRKAKRSAMMRAAPDRSLRRQRALDRC